jgi:hypothetical protein
MNKKFLVFIFVIVAMVLGACVETTVSDVEQSQQQAGNMAIVQNQPVPDLGGYSFERQIVIETYLARNNTVATWAYMFAMDGKIIELCPSIGYPIPYSTQLTNPSKIDATRIEGMGHQVGVTENAEPNGLYTPSDAAATLVQCVNPDGSVSPTYIEWYVLAFPYRIASDIQVQRIGDPSFSVQVQK